MSKKEEILLLLRRAVETWNADLAREAAEDALDLGIDPCEAIEQGLGKGMDSISDRYYHGKIFLPQVLAASRAMETGISVFEQYLCSRTAHSKGVVIMGTVQGDIHEIGKHVVCAFLRGAGYTVYDLGKDVSPDEFIQTAREKGACLIGASALMTTTLVGQKRIVDQIKEEKILDLKTIFGGACCTPKWVESIGGDAYCSCGAKVVAEVETLLSDR
ncbi:MAG: dimethylamine methyltransferase [Euryarchaeota archaeon]|nr:dimethylamine methyltransferase [Euryarchaeota archaeon]